ncbi:MAG TPA: hypothetical protein VEX13_01485 [Chloroflexia bacterium]|nr:hypothetical protein [Chloroflexia bacterium]
MDTGRPARVRRVRYRDTAGGDSRPAVDPIRIVAGIGAILFPVLHVMALNYVSIERRSGTDHIAGIIFMIAYTLLLPLVYVLYQELSAVSRPLGVAVSVMGLGAPIGVAGGVTGALDLTTVMAFIAVCLSLWIGLAGIVAFWRRLLPRVWALFSAAMGGFALVIAILDRVGSPDSAASATLWLIYILAVAIWTVWTGVMFLLRARMAPDLA